jgi:hypothetical protein
MTGIRCDSIILWEKPKSMHLPQLTDSAKI